MAEAVLELRLNADGSGLVGTLRTASGELRKFTTQAQSAGREADAAMKLAEKSAASAGKAIGIAVAGAISTVGYLIKQQIDLADQTGTTAQRLGITTEALSALGASAKRNNADMRGVVSGLEEVGSAAVRAATQTTAGGRASAAAFNAIGVAVKDAQGHIKPTTQLLEEVARGLAKLPDGAVKTEVATRLLGKSGKDLASTLDDLARNGMQGLIDKATQTGEVITSQAAVAAKRFNDDLTELKSRVGAFAAGIAQDALPTLLALSGALVDTGNEATKAGTQTSAFRGFIEGLGRGLVYVTETLRLFFTIIYGGIDAFVGLAMAAGRSVQAISLMGQTMVALNSGNLSDAARFAEQAKRTFAQGWDDITSHASRAWMNIQATSAGVNEALDQYDKKIAAGYSQFRNVVGGVGPVLDDTRSKTEALDKATAALATTTNKHNDTSKAAIDLGRRFADELQRASNTLAALNEADGAYTSALNARNKVELQANQLIADATVLYAKHKISLDQLRQAQQLGTAMIAAAGVQYDKTTAKIKAQIDSIDGLLTRIDGDRALVGLSEREQAIQQAVDAATDAFNANTEAYEKNGYTLADVTDKAASAAAGLYDLKTATQASQEAARDWSNIWTSAGNSLASTFADVIVNGKSLFDGLRSLAKQTVTAIIEYFARLAVINPILNAIFGRSMIAGGGSLLPTLASAAIGGGGSGMAGGLVQSAASTYLTGSGGGGISGLFSPTAWINAGKSIWQGFAGSAQSVGGSSMFGTWSGTQFGGVAYAPTAGGSELGLVPNYAGGAPNTVGVSSMSGSYTPSALGYGVAIAGGVYAGLARWQNSNKDLGGALGGVAYGVGTYSAAIGAGAAISGGLAAGMAAIPVVGWIALAAMAVDMISGGKLFGTGSKLVGGGSNLAVDQGGANLTQWYTTKDQGAFFSGAEWNEHAMDPSAEAVASAQAFFTQIQKGADQLARQLGLEAGTVVAGSFQTAFDKNGKQTGTTTTIAGHTYKDETQEQFATRLLAESGIATLAKTQWGAGLEAFIDPYRRDAETLADAVQMLTMAATDLKDGFGLLSHGNGLGPASSTTTPVAGDGDGAGGWRDGFGNINLAYANGGVFEASLLDDSADAAATANDMLARTGALVAELSLSGEKLADAYGRLQQDTTNLQTGLDLMHTSLALSSEDFVRFAAGVEEAAGGLDAANKLWNAYFTGYYSQQEVAANQLEALGQNTANALAAIGMSASISMADFRTEFEAAMPTLTADQVAQWLQAANALAQLTQAQVQLEQQAAAVLGPMGLMGHGLSGFGQALLGIKGQEQAAIDAANALAHAHGREGASAVQLAQIHDWASKQIAAALRRLQVETRDLVAKLYGGIPASLEAINAQISALEGASGGDAASQISDAQRASNELFESWKSGIKSVQDYLDSMLIGDLSALSPEEQLAEAKRQLVAAQQAALHGDAQALSKLPQMADAFLRLERQFDASGADYNAQFDWVRQLLGSVSGLPNPGTQASDPIAVAVSASPELQALYAARDAALAAQENDYRANLAQQLAQNLHDLAVATSTPILQMIGLQGVALDRLATDMGVNLSDLTGQSVLALGNMATTLGLSLTELTGALGLSLTNLSGGVTELTQRLGIDLGNLTVQSTQTLAELANSLGADLSDLAQSVGIDLGSLVDRQSLLNEALAATISELPDDTRDQLAPLLEAITNATNEADANSAIHALEDAINLLAPDLRAQLAPYLAGVTPPDALTEIDYLSQLQDIGHDQLDVLRDIARGLDVPGYAIGTGYVPQTGLATIHQGEAILPTPVAGWLRANGFPLAQSGGGAANDGALLAEVRTLGLKVDALMRATTQGSDKIADSLRTGEARAQAQRDEIARNTRGGLNRSAYG